MSSSCSSSTNQPTTSSLDEILLTLQPKNVRDAHDTLFLILHAFLISAGFRLVGLGDTEHYLDDAKTLPPNWRGEGDGWAFRYRHNKSSFTFVLKALRLGSRLSVHAYLVEQDDVIVGVELLVSQFVDANAESFKAFLRATQTSSPAQNAPPLQTSSNEGDKSEATTKSGEEQAKSAGQPGTASSGSSSEVAASTLPPTDEFLKDLPTLHEIFKKEVMVKLIPEVADLANQIRFQSQRGRLQQQVDSGDRSRGVPDRDDPLRVPGSGGRPRGPIPRGGYDDDYDTGYSGEPNPFAYSGDSDLFGSVGRYGEGGGFGALPSMGRGGIGRGGMGRGGGGSSVGPHHPGFGPEVSDPSRYGPGGSAGGGGAPPGYFHPPPPGARFDPFGPVVPPSHGGAPTYGGNSRSGGNPEAPPGFENWYS